MDFAEVRDPETKKLVDDRSTLVYNSRITLSEIPEESYRYMLGPRSAIEWIINRYHVKTDKASGIVNGPSTTGRARIRTRGTSSTCWRASWRSTSRP